MKSKHFATYGKKITSSNTQSNFGSYRVNDNFLHKSKITDHLARVSYFIK